MTLGIVKARARSRTSSVISSLHDQRQRAVETVASTLDQHQSFRNLGKLRDGHCCVITGDMDTEEWDRRGRPDDVDFGPVEVAYIIPFAYTSWEKSTQCPGQTTSSREVLWHCFPQVRLVGMQVSSINSLLNGITLRDYVHTQFGKYTIAFKPTDTPNVYERKLFNRFPSAQRRTLPQSSRIKFTHAPGTETFELPSTALLNCHYRLAEILNAS
ncbi:hypothetical protein ASPZODRAFT_19764 [Penicilliopsis zonata CBS 506.65]|uniref:HNH nuclease domain-containing protein n=1 Tax=Penicilliopsis zonata CBS 506.65 TaxID=1073090 RepID=A0A1L9S7C0_9EURO|nr:hypothetical protein ASPZODRAFT_19764 [Penicilliopsis zonata CBS 506.65]OJJ43065.1 hypothetical protein ASPZODRAFT_19764 [Penicilliopsis zonata CBS 506.65]